MEMGAILERADAQRLDAWQSDPRRSQAQVLRVYTELGRLLVAAHAEGRTLGAIDPGRFAVAAGVPHRIGDAADDCAVDYQAPERLRGEPATPATDQFSFCVCLFEAVNGHRPFRGDSEEAVRAAIMAGDTAKAPDASPWLRNLLRRGLSPDPDERFPHMSALLTALGDGRQKTARWTPYALGAAGMVFVGALSWTSRQQASVCDEAPVAYDEERGDTIRRRFAFVAPTYGTFVASRVEPALRSYGEDWSRAWLETCRSAPSAGPTVDARRLCIDQARVRVQALADAWVDADEAVVAAADVAIAQLPPLSSCQEQVKDASAPADNKRIAVEQTLARAETLLNAGMIEEATRTAVDAQRSASGLRLTALEAEATLLVGRGRRAAGFEGEAEDHLRRAFDQANAAKATPVAFSSAAELVGALSRDSARLGEAASWAERAQALASSAIDPLQRAQLDATWADLRLRRDELDDAKALLDRATATLSEHQDRAPQLALKLDALAGELATKSGEPTKAVKLFTRVLAHSDTLWGTDHPQRRPYARQLAEAQWTLAKAEVEAGHPDVARNLLDQAKALFEESGAVDRLADLDAYAASLTP